ncbi:DUF4352 domain-containing protein [Chengkuizengella axinellae]|uniref:DUF4352 domain-containing protein n=1 Tax=Chengkuizengella axinellae TaxID=3064388 RepID=A0ABT9IWF4_9BACL|nr:DUF4352 domain-containing protein [Chengkuizengella sp. 2205SS18-9]MDP5273665.1 DUF4352 domain-containing protein [Chengkuizengella sp. 2205SS18-9]
MNKKKIVLCLIIVSLSISVGCSQETLSRDEEVNMGDWTYSIYNSLDSGVNGTMVLERRTESTVPQFSTNGSHFIVITMLIRNDGNNPIEIDGSQFQLMDANGKTYNFYEPTESIKSLNINPQLQKSIDLIFEVPDNIQTDIKIKYDNSNILLLIGDYETFLDDTMF